MKLSVSSNTRSLVQVPAAREAGMKPSDNVEIAVNVKAARYVPRGVTLRARLDDRLFTAITKASNLDRLEQDPCITSVQVGRTIHEPETTK
jgi:hypothetical protein